MEQFFADQPCDPCADTDEWAEMQPPAAAVAAAGKPASGTRGSRALAARGGARSRTHTGSQPVTVAADLPGPPPADCKAGSSTRPQRVAQDPPRTQAPELRSVLGERKLRGEYRSGTPPANSRPDPGSGQEEAARGKLESSRTATSRPAEWQGVRYRAGKSRPRSPRFEGSRESHGGGGSDGCPLLAESIARAGTTKPKVTGSNPVGRAEDLAQRLRSRSARLIRAPRKGQSDGQSFRIGPRNDGLDDLISTKPKAQVRSVGRVFGVSGAPAPVGISPPDMRLRFACRCRFDHESPWPSSRGSCPS